MWRGVQVTVVPTGIVKSSRTNLSMSDATSSSSGSGVEVDGTPVDDGTEVAAVGAETVGVSKGASVDGTDVLVGSGASMRIVTDVGGTDIEVGGTVVETAATVVGGTSIV